MRTNSAKPLSGVSFLYLYLTVAMLLAARDMDVWFNPHFFAEDGTIFYAQQIFFGFASLITPYNGYLHTIPRLGAAITSLFSPSVAPLLFAVIGTLVAAAGVSWFFLPVNRVIVRSDALRATSCVAIACNFDVHDMTGNLLNLQWFLLPMAVLMICHCLYGDETLSDKWTLGYAIAIGAIGLTTPILLVLAPVWVWVAWKARRERRVVAWVLVAAVCIQAVVFLRTHDSGTPMPPFLPFWQEVKQSLGATCTSWCYRITLTALMGRDNAISISNHWQLAFPIGLVCSIAVTIYLTRKRLGPLHVKIVAWGFFFSLYLTIAPLLIRNTLAYYGRAGELQGFNENPRYYLFGCFALVFMCAIYIERLARGWSATTGCIVLFLLFIVGALSNFSAPDGWRENWRDSAWKVERWQDLRNAHQPRVAVAAPIRPVPWSVNLPGSIDGR